MKEIVRPGRTTCHRKWRNSSPLSRIISLLTGTIFRAEQPALAPPSLPLTRGKERTLRNLANFHGQLLYLVVRLSVRPFVNITVRTMCLLELRSCLSVMRMFVYHCVGVFVSRDSTVRDRYIRKHSCLYQVRASKPLERFSIVSCHSFREYVLANSRLWASIIAL